MSVDPLTPPAEVLRARTAFPHYEICQFHDPTGTPEAVAVLKPGFHGTGLAVLIGAATVAELAEILDGQPRPPLPRRDPARRYWPFP